MYKSALLVTKRDYLLTETIRYICRDQKVNLIYCLNKAEMVHQTFNNKPEIVFFDEENVDFPYDIYKEFVDSKLFYIPEMVLITQTPAKFDFKDSTIKVVNKKNLCQEIPTLLKETKEKPLQVLSAEVCEKIKEKTTLLLNDLGITPKFLGYDYIKELVVLIKTDKRLLQSFNKKLYPILAMKLNINVNNIERNIRNAILVASKRSKNRRLFDEICNRNSLIVKSSIPSNKQFLTWVVEQVA